MKNKGFTLVELLAVIVVLAVISIITIPMIGNVIEESKKKALEQSVNGLVEAARYYSIDNDGTYEFLFDENKKGETINGDSLDYRGSINAEGKLYLDQDGNISICVYNDKYYAYKNYNSGIVIGNRSEDNCDIGYDVISNKYIAFLESEGMSNNIYSKDEVNNLIDNVDSKVTTNKNEITNIKSTIETLQNNLNSYALQSSLNETNTNLNNLSSIVGSHTETINNLSSSLYTHLNVVSFNISWLPNAFAPNQTIMSYTSASSVSADGAYVPIFTCTWYDTSVVFGVWQFAITLNGVKRRYNTSATSWSDWL